MKKMFLSTLLLFCHAISAAESPILFLNVNQAFNRHSKIAGSLEWSYIINLKEQLEFAIAGDIKTYCHQIKQIEQKFIEGKMSKEQFEKMRQGMDFKIHELYNRREEAATEMLTEQDKIRHKLYAIATRMAKNKGAKVVLVLNDDQIIYLAKNCDITPDALFQLNKEYLEGMGVIIEDNDLDYRLDS